MFEQAFSKCGDYILGSDEVGRGCLAGPVVCCSSIFYFNKDLKPLLGNLNQVGVRDSKKLTRKKILLITKELLEEEVERRVEVCSISKSKNQYFFAKSKYGFSCCISVISPDFIDKNNILNSSLYGMKVSGDKLIKKNDPENWCWLVDGNKTWVNKSPKNQVTPIVSGDQKSTIIAVSSIIAKHFRDLLMEKASKRFPQYGFSRNVGYPTKEHYLSLKKYGHSEYHRLSFRGVLQS